MTDQLIPYDDASPSGERLPLAVRTELEGLFAPASLTETKLDTSEATAIYSRRTRPAVLHAIGDSITAASYNISQSGSRWVFDGSRNPWAWAHILSGGRIRLGSISATGGYTSTQIKDTHLPVALSKATPGDLIAVLCGTNDTSISGSIGGTLSRENLLSMYQSIHAAGCYPVLCTIPPRSNESGEMIRTCGSREGVPSRKMICKVSKILIKTSAPTLAGRYARAHGSTRERPVQRRQRTVAARRDRPRRRPSDARGRTASGGRRLHRPVR